jgi:hypothetical protein
MGIEPMSLWGDLDWLTVHVELALLRIFASKARQRRIIGMRNRRKWSNGKR